MLWNCWNITKKYYWEIFKILLVLSLVGLVLSHVSLIDVNILMRQVSFFWIFGAVISFVVGFLELATRYWRLLDDNYLLSANPITISPIIINNPVISFLKNLLDKFLYIYWWALRYFL